MAQAAVGGVIFWDSSTLQYELSTPCQGLQVSLIDATKKQLQPLATLTSFSPTWSTPQFNFADTSHGQGPWMACSYVFRQAPENTHLQVRATITQRSAFTPQTSVISAPDAQTSDLVIPGGNCNSTPQSTLGGILFSAVTICGENAFNVNFQVLPASVAHGMLPAGNTVPQVIRPPLPQTSGALLSSTRGSGQIENAIGSASTASGQLMQTQSSPAGMLAGNTAGAAAESPRQSLLKQPSTANGATPTTNLTAPAVTNSTTLRRVTPSSETDFVPTMPPMSGDPKRDASRPADDATKAQIKSKLQAQLLASRQMLAQPANRPPRSVTSANSDIQALQNQTAYVQSLHLEPRPVKAPPGAALTANEVVRNIRPAPNPMLKAPAPIKVCLTPQIHAVNGRTTEVRFTQDPKYNHYIIAGCGFGDQPGQVYLSGAITGGRIDMVVAAGAWSDTQIDAAVKPGLTGVLDGWPDLIVAPAGSATPAKLPNNRFYAERQSVLLPYIPQQYATLAPVKLSDGTQITRYCPGPDLTHFFPCIAYNAGIKLDGMTNGVDHRNDSLSEAVSNAVDRDGFKQQFDSGEDVYDLSYMAPGFEVDYPTVYWYAWTSDVCEGWASDAFPKKVGDTVWYETLGHYQWYEKSKTKVVVDWGVDHCAWRWLAIFKVDDWYNAGYSLQVFVKGPIGVDPWTGHPVKP